MFTITDGTVSYTRTVKPADYEGKTPVVKLSFTVAEGSDPEAVVAKVMAIAVNEVEGVLTGKRMVVTRVDVPAIVEVVEQKKGKRASPPTSTPSPTTSTEQQSSTQSDPSLIEGTPSAPTPTVPAPSDQVSVDASVPVLGTGVPDPSAIDDTPVDPSLEALGITDPVVVDEPLDMKDLQKMAQTVSAKLSDKDGNIGKLLTLIKDCGGPPLQKIPSGNFKVFMEKCKGLLASL